MNTTTPLSEQEAEQRAIVHVGEVTLTAQQQQALEWLMNGGSVAEAAQYAGVARQTVSRWIHEDPDFAALFEHWQAQTRTATKARVIALTEAAMDTVTDAIRNHKDVRAALALLKGAGVLAK
jgi:hypothetical protein